MNLDEVRGIRDAIVMVVALVTSIVIWTGSASFWGCMVGWNGEKFLPAVALSGRGLRLAPMTSAAQSFVP